MRVKIENIGMIKKADIDLSGLTVLVGENDVDKSTVGKLLFAIIRAFNKFEDEFEADKFEYLDDQLARLYGGIRKSVDFEKNGELRRQFYPGYIMEEIRNIMISKDYNEEEKNRLVLEIFKERLEIIDKCDLFEPDKSKELVEILNDLIFLFSVKKDDAEVLKRALKKMFKFEFAGQVNNLDKSEGSITCIEGENNLFRISVQNQEVVDIVSYDDLFLEDVTYIESPIIIQVHNLLFGDIANNWRFHRRIPMHMVDLIEKLQISEDLSQERYLSIEELIDNKKNQHDIVDKEITRIIHGNVTYKRIAKDFIYKKRYGKEEFDIVSENIATGIKSLGMLQMLVHSGVLNDRGLLIIDEPEVHLHPKWQVEYAKIILEVVKLNVPVLIKTHSPYILQALRYYSEKAKCTDLVKYYLAEMDEDGINSTFEDITGSLSKAFQKLSDPMQRLVWYGYESE